MIHLDVEKIANIRARAEHWERWVGENEPIPPDQFAVILATGDKRLGILYAVQMLPEPVRHLTIQVHPCGHPVSPHIAQVIGHAFGLYGAGTETIVDENSVHIYRPIAEALA